MNVTITKRGLIRICTFSIAAIAVLAARNIRLMNESKNQSRTIEYSYMRAVEDLSTAADNISSALSKGIYSGTPEMLENLSSKLWREASNAKIALSQLPVEELQLENTYKFLSQVGNYALAVSEKVSTGESLTYDEYAKLKSLYEFSKDFSEDMWELESQASSGKLSLSKVSKSAGNAAQSQPPTVTEGFTDFEEGFDSYPSLIYDGPFSDHILEKNPIMLENAQETTEDFARKRASQAATVNESSLSLTGNEDGKMPSFIFTDDGVTVGVTKKGCLITYMLKSRQPTQTLISQSAGLNAAADYLKKLGINDMQTTYYETYNNVLTVNFAAKQDGVVCYTDLIKVSVALDNGEILGFDARGYIVNHHERSFPAQKITEAQAKKLLSPLLTVEKTKLALIPAESTKEVLCHEFTCKTDEGTRVLVYVGVESGKEEQILILFESETGVLTM